jgi:hypothetical protein
MFGASLDSRRLAKALRLVEAVNDRLALQRLQTLVDGLLTTRADERLPKTCAEHTSF